MTRPRRRLRRILKWMGLGFCILLPTAWGFSTQRGLFCNLGYPDHSLELVLGAVWYRAQPRPKPVSPPFVSITDFYKGQRPRWRIEGSNLPGRRWAVVPLWIPFVLVVGATAFLWWRDRRILVGLCTSCGYNLTGNTTGRCPECGKEVVSHGR